MAEVRLPEQPVRIQVTDGLLIPGKGEKTLFSSWRIAFYGAIALLVALPLFGPDPYWEILKLFPKGIIVTFQVTSASILLATIVGLLAGLGQISRNPVISRIATVYVEVVRGIPLIVQIYFIYYALGKFLLLEGFVAAVISLAFCYGAYLGEIFRAGIQAIPKGQMEAAMALGLSRVQAIRLIILPQTIKIVLPAIGNEFIALLKDSSLVSVIAISDLMREAKLYTSRTFEYFEAYALVALVYLVMTLFLSRLVAFMEARLNKNG